MMNLLKIYLIRDLDLRLIPGLVECLSRDLNKCDNDDCFFGNRVDVRGLRII